MAVRSYRDLIAWQKAFAFSLAIYEATRAFPTDERFGLTSQLRRAAVSIPSNIAEGQSRSTRDFVHYLTISQGSLAELETQIMIATKLGYLHKDVETKLLDDAAEIQRLLNGLSTALKSRTNK